MNKIISYIFLIILILPGYSFSSGKLKKNENGFSFWNLKSVSGLLSLEGNYRSGTYNLSDSFSDEQKSTLLTGRLDLNTSSFIIHPNFFQLDANFSYSPARNLDNYIISPDNSEINTNERIDLNGVFFSERIISINPYFDFNHSFSRREYTTNLESFYTNYGTRLSSSNPILPFSANVAKYNWEQNEIQTGRKFSTSQFLVNTEFNRSVSDFSNNRLNIDYFDYSRKYSVNSIIKNKAINWSLNNNLTFSRSSNSNFASLISVTNQVGSQPINRFLINENLRSDLLSGFSVYGRYQYYKIIQELLESKQHDAELRIEHKLFSSLRSYISYNYQTISQTFYDEKINRGEIGFDYQKNIPTGMLRLNYNFTLNHQSRENIFGTITILDESKLLSDGTVTTLNNPYVQVNNIYVKNSAGTIIFQENFDYILIQKGIYTEVQRVPGGQISDGEIVLVSYKADQQPALNFDSKINKYGASLTLLSNFVEFYFSGTNQNYSNVSDVKSDYLKTLDQKLYGFKISYEYLDLGAEYEDYQSNITPYTSSRYFLRIFRQTSENLISTINGSYRIYNLIDENSRQNFADVSLMLAYLLNANSKLSFEGNYIFQEGRQIDLNLRVFRVEYITKFRQIDISVGYENYNRKLLEDETRYSSIFARIGRRF